MNTKWKQVEADLHELQSIPNLLCNCYGFRSLVCLFWFHGINCKMDWICANHLVFNHFNVNKTFLFVKFHVMIFIDNLIIYIWDNFLSNWILCIYAICKPNTSISSSSFVKRETWLCIRVVKTCWYYDVLFSCLAGFIYKVL